MNTILLSIKKPFCDLIFSGIKRYEFRKSVPKIKIDKIIVYESKGLGKIIGELIIDDLISGTPEELWVITQVHCGINLKQYNEYFSGKKIAYAYKIRKVIKFDTPLDISDFGCKAAPQNYVWIEKTPNKFN